MQVIILHFPFLYSRMALISLVYLVYFRELGIGIVAYSPLGRGFFSSGTHLIQNLPEGDIRKVSCAFIRLNNLQHPYKIEKLRTKESRNKEWLLALME